jgi:hypothetical protein
MLSSASSFIEYKDQNGSPYWYNPTTNETTWNRPPSNSTAITNSVDVKQNEIPLAQTSAGVSNTVPLTPIVSQVVVAPPETSTSSHYKAVAFQAAGEISRSKTATTSTTTSTSSSSAQVTMKSVGQSEEEDWIREAEMHFNTIAPPKSLQSSVEQSNLAMIKFSKGDEEAEFYEEMLAARAALDIPVRNTGDHICTKHSYLWCS